ncbi:nucleolin-like isoform X2 [Planococcus citri]
MKKKNYDEDSENEFEVDEPEELPEDSDQEWAPVKGNKRQSTGKRGATKKKSKKGSSEEDDEEEDSPKKKKAGKPKTPVKGKSPKGKGKAKEEEEDDEDLNEEEVEDEELDDEEVEEEEEEDEEEEGTNEGNTKTPKEFSSGAFVVLKSDFNSGGDPPIWKIDGKALLQKYIPFQQDNKTLYKNTSVYSGWTTGNKDQYYPATVVFKQQTRKEHIVEFQRDLIQKEETPITSAE